MRSTFTNSPFAIAIYAFITSCSLSNGDTTTSESLAPRENELDWIPFVVQDGRAQLKSIFVSVRGDREDHESWARASRELQTVEGGLFQDREGEQWRRSSPRQDISGFMFDEFIEFPLEGTTPNMLDVYRNRACDDGCILQIRASSNIDWFDTADLELSWESRPDEWFYAELEYNHEERIAMTRLVEYNDETWDAIVDLGTIILELNDRNLSAELRPVTLSGYNGFRTIRPNPDVPDAGFERSNPDRQ